MTPAWAQRQEELLRDCIVSPDVFDHYGGPSARFRGALSTRSRDRGRPAQCVSLPRRSPVPLATARMPRHIATLVDVERLVMQDFIGTAPWDHRPLVKVLVGEVVDRLGEPDGIIAFDPSSFPKRGTHSVGVKRQWCGHRGKVDNCQVGRLYGVRLSPRSCLARLPLVPASRSGHGMQQRRQACHVPEEVRYHTRHEQCLEMLDLWGDQVPHGWVTGDDELGRHTRFRDELRAARRALCAGRALHHDDAGPGGAVARVSRARTSTQGTVAIGACLATIARLRWVDTVDGARRGERPGGDRDGHPPCADAARTQTDRT